MSPNSLLHFSTYYKLLIFQKVFVEVTYTFFPLPFNAYSTASCVMKEMSLRRQMIVDSL